MKCFSLRLRQQEVVLRLFDSIPLHGCSTEQCRCSALVIAWDSASALLLGFCSPLPRQLFTTSRSCHSRCVDVQCFLSSQSQCWFSVRQAGVALRPGRDLVFVGQESSQFPTQLPVFSRWFSRATPDLSVRETTKWSICTHVIQQSNNTSAGSNVLPD